MKQAARLIIPVWGEVYANKLVSVTLPALLAPGNLPALCSLFDVELVVVTESRLFGPIRDTASFQIASALCRTQLFSLDDLLTDVPGDYGVVLTYALYRGFTDLGPRMTDTFLLFLNADFIIADGSLRHLGKLMLEGKTVIHSPSFRVILEEVWPQLQASVDKVTSTLSLKSREMVKLALAHKHQTVKARIVNQQLCHQTWMDQYYWYVAEDMLIGYQWPVALVAIKPQRAITEPVLVWDYGFIPEASPSAERHFIDDSDDFFMLEPQSRETGDHMIKPGWISVDDIAKNLSMWTTKEQRECGRELLKIHAGDLPPNLDRVVEESRAYMAQIYRRLSPTPLPHIGHSYLGPWFDSAKERMRGKNWGKSSRQPEKSVDISAAAPQVPTARRPGKSMLAHVAFGALRTIYRRTFGSLPKVRNFHPLWADYTYVARKVAEWQKDPGRPILWIGSGDSVFQRVLKDPVECAALLIQDIRGTFFEKAPYDVCLCELTFEQCSRLKEVYAVIRPLMKDGGKVVVHVVRKGPARSDWLAHCGELFPDSDVSEICFFGTAVTAVLRACYIYGLASFQGRRLLSTAITGATLVLLAPFVWWANTRATRRDSSIYSLTWTSMVIDFTVQRRVAAAPAPRPRALAASAA